MAVQKTIDLAAAAASYRANTATAGAKLVAKFNSRSGIVDAATTDSAIALMKANVVSSLAVNARTAKLKKLGDAGLKARMLAVGATNYATKTSQSVQKWQDGTTPYVQPLQTIVNGLAVRTSDPATNVLNRVTPIAVGLHAAKVALYGA